MEALRLFDGRPIDLVITDLNMPELDGIELTRQIKTIHEYTKTPVLMLTTEKDPVKKQKAYESGVKVVIQKPFDRDFFIKTIQKALGD